MTKRATRFDGVLAPVLTPFAADGAPDGARLARLCRDLKADGASGLAIFGTTSEANSLSLAERLGLLDGLVEAGIPADRLMPGTGACALADAITLTSWAVDAGAGGVLVLPPFYYKNVSDEGLYAAYAGLIEGVGRDDLRLYLYHIPQMSGVAITPAVIRRLIDAFGPVVAGLKDSAGDFAATRALIGDFPELAIFPGSERFLWDGLKAGGAGCISATANVSMAAIVKVWRTFPSGEGQALNGGIIAVRDVYEDYPMIAALKASIAARYGDAGWAVVRPPLVALDAEQSRALAGALDALEEQ